MPSFHPMQPSTPPDSNPPAVSNSAQTAISTSPKQGAAEQSQPLVPALKFLHPSAPTSGVTPDASRNWTGPATAPQSPPDFHPLWPLKATCKAQPTLPFSMAPSTLSRAEEAAPTAIPRHLTSSPGSTSSPVHGARSLTSANSFRVTPPR